MLAEKVVASRRRSTLCLLLQGAGQESLGLSHGAADGLGKATLHRLQEALIGVLPLQVAAGVI